MAGGGRCQWPRWSQQGTVCISTARIPKDSQTEGWCHSFAERWKRVRHRSLGQKRRNQQNAGFSPAGLSPGVCVADEGQTIRPVRSEGVARECKVVDFDLGGPKRNANSDHMQRKSLTWIARVMEETENVSGHTFESRVGPPCCVPHAVQGVVQTLCGWQGLERRHQKHPGHDDQYLLV